MRGRVALGVTMLAALAAVACGSDQDQPEGQASDPERRPAEELRDRIPMPAGDGERQPDSIDVSDEELRSFVRAQLRIGRARTRMQSDTDSAGSQKTNRQLREELNRKAAEIVREEGLEPERFAEIGRAIPFSSDLRRRYGALRQRLSDEIGSP